ncbi:hypothetical protein [Enterobacter hormaechei]|uniref:hypothetical protein n=1 Tax=Enterobacter hormaechei TaxID=158836 RepID=UPI0020751A4A|nr:hypothetical protein [Enterobacter hormaechei]EKS6383364.1 hypothetical protein [Enterobacter hormaechei]ELD3291314.1 hypothetical protein [Enterobacter hormaechei]ELD3429876.1 hypothetical protein [Enterobacter hormaechei]MCM7436323.1 hypothetical protein [Enterobacter hormaechei]
MSTLTKEWLLTTIAELEEERDATPGAVNEDASMALAAMKLALASLEAEAVADVVAWSSPNEERTCDIRMRRHDIKPGSLYTAPPAPEFYKIGDATMRHIFTPTGITDVSDMQAVFDQIETVLAGMWQPAPVSVPDAMDGQGGVCCEVSYADGWNSCRAAMLQGAEPVTTAYKLPEGWVAVPVEPTEEMIAAAMCSNDVLFDKEDDTLFRVQHGEIWRAMLSTAPQQEAK